MSEAVNTTVYCYFKWFELWNFEHRDIVDQVKIYFFSRPSVLQEWSNKPQILQLMKAFSQALIGQNKCTLQSSPEVKTLKNLKNMTPICLNKDSFHVFNVRTMRMPDVSKMTLNMLVFVRQDRQLFTPS